MADFGIDVDDEELIALAKPLFYAFVAFAGFTMLVSPGYAGAVLGAAVIAAISFVSAGLAESMEGISKNIADTIAMMALLGSLLAGSYIALTLSTTV